MNYLYCPGGIAFNTQEFLKKAEAIAKRQKSVFLKVEPMITQDVSSRLSNVGFSKSVKEIQPQRTNIIDLALPEEELLSPMHPKARYNVGLAKKHGVHVYASSSPSDVEIFLDLLKKTSTRDGFSSHPPAHYRNLLHRGGSERPLAKLFLAEKDGRILAANIIVFFGDTATYLHGASDYDNRRYMAPYLLQWEGILEAKRRGYKKYDFWGIDEKKWPGVTRFKKGFGGKEVEYVGSYDYIYRRSFYTGYLLKQMYFRGRI